METGVASKVWAPGIRLHTGDSTQGMMEIHLPGEHFTALKTKDARDEEIARSRTGKLPRSLVPKDQCLGFPFRHPPIMEEKGKGDQVFRLVSTGQLNTSPCLHLRPINLVVFKVSHGIARFGTGFALRCFQRLSIPYLATLLCS